jgi:hypothetical protein
MKKFTMKAKQLHDYDQPEAEKAHHHYIKDEGGLKIN